jgi:hypothetical protein
MGTGTTFTMRVKSALYSRSGTCPVIGLRQSFSVSTRSASGRIARLASEASVPAASRSATRRRNVAGVARQSRIVKGTRSSAARASKLRRSAPRRKAASTITG